MFSVNYIYLLNITCVFAIITCFGLLVSMYLYLHCHLAFLEGFASCHDGLSRGVPLYIHTFLNGNYVYSYLCFLHRLMLYHTFLFEK